MDPATREMLAVVTVEDVALDQEMVQRAGLCGARIARWQIAERTPCGLRLPANTFGAIVDFADVRAGHSLFGEPHPGVVIRQVKHAPGEPHGQAAGCVEAEEPHAGILSVHMNVSSRVYFMKTRKT